MNNPDVVEVAQADKKAAQDALDALLLACKPEMLSPDDAERLIQESFARHRLAAEQRLREQVEEAVKERDDAWHSAATWCRRFDDLAVQVERLVQALRPFVDYVHDDIRSGMARYEIRPTEANGGGWIGAEDFKAAAEALADYRKFTEGPSSASKGV